MPNHPSIDLETFRWVKGEIDVTLQRAEEQVQQYVRSDAKVDLYNLVNHLHQVVGSLQMLELKSLSTLLLETEALVEDFIQQSSPIRKASFVVLIDSTLSVLRANLERIESGQEERAIEIVELVNQVRAVRGKDDIEISSLFSPNIEVFPPVNAERALRDKVYIQRAGVLRGHYQVALLDFLKYKPQVGAEKMRAVFDKVLEMSAFGTVARLWWVATAYADFLRLNEISNRAVHTRILRQIDDLLRSLAQVGESALVSDPADELVKIMLFYVVAGEQRSPQMAEIVAAFSLQDYFVESAAAASEQQISELIKGLLAMSPNARGLVSKTRDLVTDYFESESPSDEHLIAFINELEALEHYAQEHAVEFLAALCRQSTELVKGIRSGEVIANDETGFHLASAIIFIDNCVSFPNEFDVDAYETGQSKLLALSALSDASSAQIAPNSSTLSSRERKELLNVIGSEIARNLQEVEARLEAFALDLNDAEQLIGIGDKVTQVRGALQVLGEQKVGLLLTIAEQQFRAIERQDKAATPELVEALAISIGTIEEYVRGLKSGRVDMDYILDRSITDLEVAIGKRVMRADVESLLETASGSLIAWLSKQNDFDLFNRLKSAHRDLTVLARKTKMVKVEQLVREQDRLIDVISQEPAFLTDNIIANLQNNMAEITGLVIELYGTEESPEEHSESSSFVMRSRVSEQDAGSVRIHDDMDLSEVDVDIQLNAVEEYSSTFLAREHAAREGNAPRVNDAVFQAFVEECQELVEESKQYQRACEDDLDDREAIRNLRRVFHTLKGSSRMVGLDNIGEISWLCESMFNYVLDTGKPLTFSALAFAQKVIDEIDRHRRAGFRSGEKINITSWGNEARNLSSAIDESDDAKQQKQALPTMDVRAFVSEPVPDDAEHLDAQEASAVAADGTNGQSPNVNDADPEVDSVDEDLADEDVLELTLEVSDELDLRTPLADGGNRYSEAESINEIDLSDVDWSEDETDDDTIEYSAGPDKSTFSAPMREATIELEGDEDEFLFFEDSDSDSDSDETVEGSSYLSFQVMEDESMRDIFEREVGELLQVINEQIVDLGVPYREDDTLAICLHTLLGNARTLGVEPVALAYAQAEAYCHARQEQEATLSLADQTRFTQLVALTREFLDSAQDQPPYFLIDEPRWLAQVEEFRNAIVVDLEKSNSQSTQVSGREQNASIDLAAINLELDMISDDDADLIELSELINPDADNDDIQIADALALLEGDEDAVVSADSLADDLDEIEASLKRFNRNELLISSSESEDEDAELDDDEDELILKPEGAYRKTLIPVEIDDLLLDGQDDESVVGEVLEFDVVDAIDAPSEELAPQEDRRKDDPTESADTAARGEPAADSAATESLAVELPAERPFDAQIELSSDEGEDEVDAAIQQIFVEEMREIHNKLDQDVAQLNDLKQSAPIMANVMRHLHTVKGSALMAEATVLGALAHSMESFLESGFIRDADDLKHVKNTLEYFVDDLDTALTRYAQRQEFSPNPGLVERFAAANLPTPAEGSSLTPAEGSLLRPADGSSLTSADGSSLRPAKGSVTSEATVGGADAAVEIVAIDAAQFLAGIDEVQAQVENVFSQWRSARGWWKVRPQLVMQVNELTTLATRYPPAQEALPLLEQVLAVVQTLQFGTQVSPADEFNDRSSALKSLLLAMITTMRGGSEATIAANMSNLHSQLASLAAFIQVAQSVAASAALDAADAEQEQAQAQGSRSEIIDAALRIRADTLDSLTNFVGDASMNRSQMREDVTSLKGVVSELFRNVERFGSQLRELEIEADTRISARAKEQENIPQDAEFDPLELDRYTKLQQLSRGLTENLDELGEIQNALNDFVHKTESSLQRQDRLNRDLQDEIMQVRMVSFGGIAPQLRQLARRTARELGKEVELEILGSEVRLDKTILDGVTPALEHMLRNAIDHGIELPEVRRAAGKPSAGRVVISCRQVSREIIISIKDDGAGLDLAKIKAKAVANKLLDEEQELKPEDMLIYISQSGFSTAEKLTEISGRGIGMDVVQTSLRRLSGSIHYDLENKDAGSDFVINLPISLAVTSAMFVRVGDANFAVPARVIERMVKLDAAFLAQQLAKGDAVTEVDGKRYKLVDLADYLGFVSSLATSVGKVSVILVDSGVQNIAVIVDELLDTQEIVVKNLGEHLGRVPIYQGATIRPNGTVALVLDLVGISYYESTVALPDRSRRGVRALPLVMVVDDSLTIRKAAQRDLTALGIDSVLAKNGVDAQQAIAKSKPDMVMLDIEMPEMDGFELLHWLRENSATRDLPVVMISSRSTAKYMDKAQSLGADGFLSKPYRLDELIDLFNEYLPLEAPLPKNQAANSEGASSDE